MPEEFPDLSSAKVIVVDIETRDDHLKERGPGVRRDGYIIGVAIGTEDGFRKYYPVAHDEGPNLNKNAVFSWLREEFRRSNQIKIGTNLLYDFDFLAERKIEVKGPWYDVQNAEPLIDENSGQYNLDVLSMKYLKRKKKTTELEEECARRKLKGDVQKHLWRFPARLVGPYAEEDVDLPLKIFREQKRILESEDLWDLFMLETRLMPMLLYMRRLGVRINVKRLDALVIEFGKRLRKRSAELDRAAGMKVEYWAAASIGRAFDSLKIPYPRTPKTGQPSFTQDFLKRCEHPIAALVLECRTLDKFKGTFLEGSMQEQLIGERIHCLFNQQRSDEYGTVTGRFSSSHPNLQFIPVRDEELGPLCRAMFIPEEGCWWGKHDYSQIEFRIFAHYAIGAGSDGFRQQYRDDPRIDFHAWCAEEASVSRKDAKTINFGMIYGIGIESLAKKLGRSFQDTKAFLERYNARIPFARRTLQKASDQAADRGYVKTILNRRRRFVLWEPFDWRFSKQVSAVRDSKLMEKVVASEIERAVKNGQEPPRPGIRRAKTHKALNAVIQGSAADLVKKAMVDVWEAGIAAVLKIHLTVHDELDSSVPKTREGKEAFEEMGDMMEKAIPFKVPVIVDRELLKNWGEK
jgi:DNA polymerase I-like protein with 3'-5' exonuclease and polymerase domains